MKPNGEVSQTKKARLKLYQPTSAQLAVHNSPHNYNVICYGRQSGKSTYAINKLLDRGWRKPGGMFWYVGPTYRLAEQMYERTLFALSSSPRAITYKSDTSLQLELYSGSKLFFKSGDNPGALLGETLDGVVIDECREQQQKIWTHYIMPMLGTTGGWADFLSTPNGFDWFYDLYQKHFTESDWGGFHAPSTSNPLWTPEMIEAARAEMSDELFAQEIMAEFRDLGSGSCFVSFGTHNIVDRSPFAIDSRPISPYLPILVGMDFNLNPMAWVLGQMRGNDFHFHDEIYLERTHTEEAAKVLVERVRGHKPGIVICGDASGKSGQRAAKAGESDYSVIKNTLREAGIAFTDKTPNANPPIKDRVNAFNASCKAADGSIHLTVSRNCKHTIKDLQRRRWKEGAATLAFDNSDPMIGHASDAVSYPVFALAPIKRTAAIAMHVIDRSF